jgi:hypothetical protein
MVRCETLVEVMHASKNVITPVHSSRVRIHSTLHMKRVAKNQANAEVRPKWATLRAKAVECSFKNQCWRCNFYLIVFVLITFSTYKFSLLNISHAADVKIQLNHAVVP